MVINNAHVREALNNAGAVLVRANGHLVFRLPNGKMLTVSRSASDRRAVKNILADIRRLQRA